MAKLQEIVEEAEKNILQNLPLHAIAYAVESRPVPKGQNAGIRESIIDSLICRRLNPDQYTNDQSRPGEDNAYDKDLYGFVSNLYKSVKGKDTHQS